MLTRAALLILAIMLNMPAAAADYRKLFRETDPAVVTLYTIERQVAPVAATGEVALPGIGSGFVIDKEGHIITAAHVVHTADFVKAEFADGTQIPAAIVASDPVMDVALLKLDRLPDDLTTVSLGDSNQVEVGEEIFVIGAPLGLSHTLSVGHISGRHRDDKAAKGMIQAEVFQTDAAINQGNSGGPMFNVRGEVIGVVSFIRSQSGGSDGLGFAVTSNAAKRALFERRLAWSGLSGTLLTGEIGAALNIPQQYGYLVEKVAANSPAARTGLRPSRIPAIIGGQEILIGGDIILAIDDLEVSPQNLRRVREEAPDSQKALTTLRVLRGGAIETLRVTQ